MIKERNIVVAIILSIVTCGIYGIIWFITLTDDTNTLAGSDGTTGAIAFLLTLVTCGIYGFYWAYKLGEKIDKIKTDNGEAAGNNAILFLVLQIFGLGIVNYCIAQGELNKHANS